MHGAFADASSWNGVIERLQAKGVAVTAPANPLRGIATDSAYIAGVFEQIDGPVLAVGHSYGGAVITNAATEAENVVGLVFVAAFAPDEGEALGEAAGGLEGQRPEQRAGALQYPTRGRRESATSSPSIPRRPATPSRATCRPRRRRVMAATQRPVAESAFSEPSGPPAWKSLPSWTVVATGDKAAGDRSSSARWRSGPARRSPRSRART